jgi:hypothetical protein
MRFLKKTLQPCWPTLSSLHDCVHMACWVLGAAVQQCSMAARSPVGAFLIARAGHRRAHPQSCPSCPIRPSQLPPACTLSGTAPPGGCQRGWLRMCARPSPFLLPIFSRVASALHRRPVKPNQLTPSRCLVVSLAVSGAGPQPGCALTLPPSSGGAEACRAGPDAAAGHAVRAHNAHVHEEPRVPTSCVAASCPADVPPHQACFRYRPVRGACLAQIQACERERHHL